MESSALVLTKLYAAVAWADGELSDAESARVESIATELRLPQEERAEVARLLREPVPFDESLRLARTALGRISPEERRSFITRIRELTAADGSVSAEEAAAIAEVAEAALDAQQPEGLVGSLRGIWKRRSGNPVAEAAGVTWIRLRERIGQRPLGRKEMDPTLYARSVVLGGLLYRVALSDGVLDEEELARIGDNLEERMNLTADEIDVVLSAVRTRVSEDMDRQRLCAAFNRFAEMETREQALRCLFDVASADGVVSDAEAEELRLIANYLWIDARAFNRIRFESAAAGR